MNQVAEYIKYRWKAKKRHGIHSPFVYELSDKALKIKANLSDREILEKISKSYLNDFEIIQITDFGAGSKKMGNMRSISSIYKNGSIGKKYGELMYALVAYYKSERILELGTSLGMGASYMHLGNPDSRIITIEACPETASRAERMFEAQNFKNVQLYNTRFSDYLQKLENDSSFDFIFIDGHHDGEALIHYFETLWSHSNDKTIFIFDDIRWSDSMFRAWTSLISNPEIHLSIDFFRMGLVMKKSDQQKEHFTIRF